ncbi:hypothetical protein EDD18DRAFT_1358831 [Armillaria luteobubalina]|uniref:Uncharacterized protein n=1 Tax=Armillaria luteobubalina TaxID=153913 RepID=A0AA39PTD0_9AGAR|nr:hypothetical protein EDD18DRAFT_1358831 [Armillaria luteobubalina]
MEESSNIDDSSLSSESDGLPRSLVLSTSTVQTTPSSPSKEVVLVTVSPVFDTPRLFRPRYLMFRNRRCSQGIWKDPSITFGARYASEPKFRRAGDSFPVSDVNEAEADEDLDYDPYYDKGFCFQEDDEMADLPVRKRALDGVAERSGRERH